MQLDNFSIINLFKMEGKEKWKELDKKRISEENMMHRLECFAL